MSEVKDTNAKGILTGFRIISSIALGALYVAVGAALYFIWGCNEYLSEYILQVPANRIGYKENGGPFSLMELKVIQEVITLLVFTIFSLLFFKNENFRFNHLIGFVFLVMAVYFIFKK